MVNGSDESPAVVELPDDAIEQALVEGFGQARWDGMNGAEQHEARDLFGPMAVSIAARVRAEAARHPADGNEAVCRAWIAELVLAEDDFIDIARRVLAERGIEVARSDVGRVYDELRKRAASPVPAEQPLVRFSANGADHALDGSGGRTRCGMDVVIQPTGVGRPDCEDCASAEQPEKRGVGGHAPGCEGWRPPTAIGHGKSVSHRCQPGCPRAEQPEER